MSETKKILWKGRIPEEIRVLLSDAGIAISQNEGEAGQCHFRFGIGNKSNISLGKAEWSKINSAPKVYFNENILEWDIPQLIFKRLLAGEGALGPEENYKGVLLKTGTFKIMNPGSLGYFSDLLSSFPTSLKVNPVNIRAFSISLFSFFDYLAQSDLVTYPIDVDYGVSQDCFFIQAHCDSHNLHLENILDSTQEHDANNPMKSLIDEALGKTDLLEIYGLNSSSKFVVTSCWVGNPNFMRSQITPTLMLHQLESFKTSSERKGRTAEIQTLNSHSIEDYQRIKIAEALPKKYQKEKQSTAPMTVNPILVRRLVTFVKEHAKDTSFEDFDVEALRSFYPKFPDKEAIGRINELEEEEVVNVLMGTTQDFEAEVEKVKEKIPPQDYLEKIVSSLENMSFDEAVVAADLEEDDDIVEDSIGQREDLTEETQLVSGEREDLTEETQLVSGEREDLTEETQLVSGEREDLTEETQLVSGEREDLTEETQMVSGEREDLTEETQLVSGEREDLTEETQMVSGEREDLTEETQMVSGDREDLTEAKEMVSGEKGKTEAKQVIKGEKATEDKTKTIISNEPKKDSKSWELKRLKVVQKIKEKTAEFQAKGLSHKEIDENIKQILSDELNLSEEKSQHFASSLSDDASDDIVNEGIDVLNENIKQRYRLEKVENQLALREKQVSKMKTLIEGLKKELAQKNVEKITNQKPTPNREEFNQEPINQEVALAQHEVTNKRVESQEVSQEVQDELGQFTIAQNNNPTKEKDSEELQEVMEELDSYKEQSASLKAKSIELERELSKYKNDLKKVESEKEVLLRKLKEKDEAAVEFRGSDEDTDSLKKKNEVLETQVESLKSKISFMYENSKSNKDIAIGANEVQKVIEDKERYFKEKMDALQELDNIKADLREKDRVIKQKDLELQQKSDLLKNKPIGEDQDAVKAAEKEKAELSQKLKEQAEELKAAQLKTKSFEQKVKFMNAQLQKFQNTPKATASSASGAVDSKLAAKLKQAETMGMRFKEAGEKIQKELGEKKTELHKVKLENKSMQLKIKDLEKKLLNLAKKKAA